MNDIDERLAHGPRVIVADIGVINKQGFRAYRNAVQAIPSGADDKVEFNTLTRDPFDDYDETTLYRYTPSKQGKYLITSTIQYEANISGIRGARIYKNGAVHSVKDAGAISAGDETGVTISDIVDMNGTTDYIEIFTFQDSGSDKDLLAGSSNTFLSAQRIGD